MILKNLPVLLMTALTAFAANSIFCRLALEDLSIDATSFTCLRLLSGALALIIICLLSRKSWKLSSPKPLPVFSLFVYMICFSFAYIKLSAGTGALLLFGFVQITMVGVALIQGQKMSAVAWLGLSLAMLGLVYLVSPGVRAPDPLFAILMALAGVAWGVYSLCGAKVTDPTSSTASNFMYASVLAVLVSIFTFESVHFTTKGIALALASGIFASGIGYAIWYRVLPLIPVTSAASLQLSVPALAAFGGIIFIGESLSLRLLISVLAIIGGIALVIQQNRKVSDG